MKKLVKLANSIPLIPLVWITIVEYWKKLESVEIDDNHYILELSYWDKDIPLDKDDVLKKLIALKNDVCNSYYTKEVLLNTCGFATEWVPLIWNLESPKSFLFTFTELTNLAKKIGPLKSILKPLSTNETYKIINDFVFETTNLKLDRSGTCASCGHCVSTKCSDNILDFSKRVKDIFSHKNVCRATWNPKYVCATNGSKYFQRGEYVILSYKDKSYNAKILYQRRGFNNEPGKVALVSDEGVGFFPHHPTCSYNADCPFYTQKHGLYSENDEDYILIKNHDYNKNYQNGEDNFKSSLNFDSWVNSAIKKIRVCLKCKASINFNKLPECSLAESELPIIPPAFIGNNKLEYLKEPNLVEKNLTGCFKANTYIIKLIPSLYQKNQKKNVPGINSLGLENRPDLQKANRGHVMTFKMPMEEIRNKFIKDNSIPGPSRLSELDTIFKYVIMYPTGSKEEAEKIAKDLPIRYARKYVVTALLKYFFKHHHPRLYPRNNSEVTIAKCTAEMIFEKNPCGSLVTIHKDHPDADEA